MTYITPSSNENVSRETFALLKQRNVSRETFLRLESYVNLLLKWNSRINLISKDSAKHVWTRHVLDSAQLISYLNLEETIVDIGSGGGLPAIVLSIIGVKNIHLIERDRRKSIFLQEAKKFSENTVTIHNDLFEQVNIANIEVVTARAFSDISKLLLLVHNKLAKNGRLLLLKGKNWQEEVKVAKEFMDFEYTCHPSITDNSGVVICISNLKQR